MAKGRGTTPFSARFGVDVVKRLESRSRRTGLRKSRLAERYVDEGTRMDEHPGIIFRDGPTGRRAALAGGPDVWEVVATLKSGPTRGAAAIPEVAEALDLSPARVQIALSYYGAYPEEIDERVQRNLEEADAAEAAWRNAQAALQ